MIPWMREKIAERRAKWLAARNKRGTPTTQSTAAIAAVADSDQDDGNAISSGDICADDDNGSEVKSTLSLNAPSTITPTSTSRNVNRTQFSNHGSHHRTNRIQHQHLIRNARNGISQSSNIAGSTTTLVSVASSSPRTASVHTQCSNLAPSPPSQQQKRIVKLRTSSGRQSSASSSSSQQFGINTEGTNSEEAINSTERSKEKIRVRVICPSARVLAFKTDINKRLNELKNEIILELTDDPASLPLFATDTRQLGPRYRLFRAEYEGLELNENLTLGQLHIENNDTLVLVGRRNHLQLSQMQSREVRAPNEEEIEAATNDVMQRCSDMPMVDINEIFQQSNLQFDVRKVLISLAQASAIIIGTGPYASRLIAMLKQKLINKRNYQNDTLQCLVDMGFSKEKAEHALRLTNGAYSSALEWLIQHQSDDEQTNDTAAIANNDGESTDGGGGTDSCNAKMQKSQSMMSPSGILTDNGILQNAEALLEIVRIYSHREIPPTTDTVNALIEMGFAESDVLIALKKTCNNRAAACEWLCGNRSDSLIELRDGLAQDSPILKSILEIPQVQMNLSNPKILIAFLAILENENSIRVWGGGDNDTTSVITHILQKYHEEKHVLGINQFYNNRL